MSAGLVTSAYVLVQTFPVDPAPTVGNTVILATDGRQYVYDGTAWVRSGGNTIGASVEIEIDFGIAPAWSMEFAVVDANVTPATQVNAWQDATVATGRVGNDTAWDQLVLSTIPGSGGFTLTALAVPGPVVGKRRVVYQVSL